MFLPPPDSSNQSREASTVEELFRKDEKGKTIYFPPFGRRGYLVPENREAGIRTRTRELMVFTTTAGVLFVLAIAFAVGYLAIARIPLNPSHVMIAIVPFLALLGFVSYLQLRIIAGLEALPRPSLREWLRRSRQMSPRWAHWFFLLFGLVLSLSSGFRLAAAEQSLPEIGIGVLVLLCGAFLVWHSALGLIEKRVGATSRPSI